MYYLALKTVKTAMSDNRCDKFAFVGDIECILNGKYIVREAITWAINYFETQSPIYFRGH